MEVVSETTDRFRWPILQTRQIYPPPPDGLSIEGPLQSPPPKPRLRYHRQSTYTDVFSKYPLSNVTNPKIESLWRYPVGKHGDFLGESTYEKHYRWPSKAERAEECKPPPLMSTMGLGIIPILGRGDGPQVAEMPSGEKDGGLVGKEPMENYVASLRRKNPSYWVRHCDPSRPTEQVWQAQTSHRGDYVLHPVGGRSLTPAVPHESTLRFAGKMETMSTAMRDYPDASGQNNRESSSSECIHENDLPAKDSADGNINITITISPHESAQKYSINSVS